MNIKTITCHRVYNFGASLQAYALQHFLEEQGHNVEIIDFYPTYFRGLYHLFSLSKTSCFYKICQMLPILKYILGPISNRAMFKTIGRKKSFDKFEEKYLHVTKQQYLTSNDLKANPPKADVYICGSDQIWNPNLPNGKEAAYFLDFGTDDTKRISYAASFGAISLPKVLQKNIYDMIIKINFLSVREKTGLKILGELGIDKAVQVLDPVFLLSKDEWHIVENKHPKRKIEQPYIFLYEFIGDPKIRDFVLQLSNKYCYKIVSVNDSITHDYVDVNINDAGPSDFLYLLANAEIVVCNSFHATAFAVIYEKEFYSFPIRSQKSSTRIEDLCNTLNLSDRYDAHYISKTTIDYALVAKKIETFRMKSINFLLNALKNERKTNVG